MGSGDRIQRIATQGVGIRGLVGGGGCLLAGLATVTTGRAALVAAATVGAATSTAGHGLARGEGSSVGHCFC